MPSPSMLHGRREMSIRHSYGVCRDAEAGQLQRRPVDRLIACSYVKFGQFNQRVLALLVAADEAVFGDSHAGDGDEYGRPSALTCQCN
jgi:hypothetical protein